MNVQMKPISTIKIKLGIQPGGKVQRFYCNECFRYMSAFVPGGTRSHLNKSVSFAHDGSAVIYNSPSSHYLYIGKKYVDPKYKKGAFYSPDYGFWSRPGITKTPTNQDLIYKEVGTGSRWDKRMWTSKKDELMKSIQKYVDSGCK